MGTGNFILDLYIAGFLGLLIHIFGFKLPALKKRAEKANLVFVPSEYFKKDWISFALSIITIVTIIFVFPELINQYDKVQAWPKCFMLVMGYSGSSIIQSKLSVTDKWINANVDIKTNIADNKNDL